MASEHDNGAGAKPITLDDVRAKINELTKILNGALESIHTIVQAQGALEQRLGAAELRIQQLSAAPIPANLAGPASASLQQLIEDVAELKARPLGPMNPEQQKAANAAALARESKAHAGDRMMYHPDPGHVPGARVVKNDAEEKQAVRDGYHPTLRQAALAGLGTPGGQAPAEAAVLERMEAIKRGVIKAA